MTSQEFVRHLRRLGVEIRANEGKLLVAAPAGAVTPALQDEIRGRKAELLELLRAHDSSQEERCSPLTFAQQRLWLIDRFAPDTAAYNIPQSWTIDGAIDVEAFERALDRLTERHQALRTRIEIREGEPVQVVMKQAKIPLQFTDLTHISETAREEQVREWLVREGRKAFALDHAPLIRFHIFRLAAHRFVIAYDVHHIVADQWSLNILKHDLAALYSEEVSRVPAKLPKLTLHYADVAERERGAATAERHTRQLQYWRERLKGMPMLLELPFSKTRPADQSYEGATLAVTLDQELTRELRQLAARGQTSLYLLMLAGFVTLLYRYTGQQDLCLGTPITGRKLREEEELIGLFVNMIPLRCTMEPTELFDQFLKRLSRTVPSDFERGEIPFQKLVTELHPQRSPAYSPLFQVMFALNPKGTGIDEEQEETFIGVSKFDLTLQISERAQTLDAYFEYRTDLFERTDIEQFSRHFSKLLESLVAKPEAAIDGLELLSEQDTERFQEWNSTELDFDRSATLVDLLQEQVSAHPDALALCCGDTQYSYLELNERASFLAVELRSHGAGPGGFVALCLERSAELIVAMLAVLKTGAAYLPLDPKYPHERLAYMLADSGARLLITQRDVVETNISAGNAELTVLFVAELLSGFDSAERAIGEVPCSTIVPQDLAYLIYTSGSTGKPKGVAISHSNAAALIAWARSYFNPSSLRGVLASTSVCFDLSIFEIFLPLCTGNTVILVNDVLELPRSANADRVTLINTVPSAMSALLEVSLPSSVRTVCMAGEFLPTELVDRVYAAGVEQVFDLYGPTETTTYSTCVLRERGAAATIGKPIGNTRIYLLDEDLSLVPPGALGEIFIGGEGVAQGYLNRPELTQERFLTLPEIEAQGRVYRTGDLARQLQDGSLVYMGRRDQQIKLRGHRIELGEIEAAVRDVSGTSSVAVVVQEIAGGDALVAFVADAGAGQEQVKEWAQQLRKRLPAYMIPALIVPIAKMPLTPNGKTDRKVLAMMRGLSSGRQVASAPPRDILEQWLANIWAHRLGVKRVARDAHFFEDLGGHSLVAFEIFAEIEARLGEAMMLATLFQAPTVAQLASVIRRKGWKEPKHIVWLAPATESDETGSVVYHFSPTSRASSEPLRTDGKRVMAIGWNESARAVNDLDSWANLRAREIAAFEAERPALILVSNGANREVCERLASSLAKAGLVDVTVQSV